MRRLNLLFLTVLIAVVAVFGAGMHFVHGYQMQRNASALLDRARGAEAAKDLKKTEQSLSEYLNIKSADGPTWAWYARVVDQRNSDGRRRNRVYLVHEQALRHNPGDSPLERRCADIALELGRFNDAQDHLTALLNQLPKDSQGQPAAAELEDLLGQCERGKARFDEAEEWFVKAIKHDPGLVSSYDRLARLRRTDLRRNDAADGTIQEMIAKNPMSGMAHVYRWRYSAEFLKSVAANDTQKALRSAAVNDIQEALKLAPDDPEVLLAAATDSEQKRDAATARIYFEKGFKLDPKNLALTLGLASIETQERHLDRAEAILRQAYEANPSLFLTFLLAENLIRQDKIDGKDGATQYLSILRKAGLGWKAGLADTLVRILEVEILLQGKKWAEAVPKIEMARAVLKSDPQLAVQLDVRLAEWYGRLGDDEKRLDALRRIAEGDQGPDAARVELAQTLARSGKLDQAVTTLMPLAARKPEWRLDLVRYLIQKTARQPQLRRNWQEAEGHLREAEKERPEAVESINLLRVDLLAAQGRLDDARSLLSSVLSKDPRNLRYRLTLVRLTQRQGKGAAALQILDQAEKDLGPSLDTQLARLEYWGLEGGDQAKAAVAKLAATRQQVSAADRPAFLNRLGSAEIRLGDLKLANQYWRELATLEPANLGVRAGLFDLAYAAGDQDAAAGLVDEIRKLDGAEGTIWQFARAALLIDKVRRGASENLLEEVRRLASKISERRPQWPNGFALSGEIAELAGSTDQAIGDYLRAVELGSVQPALVRRLVGLLNERNRFEEIEHVAQVLRDQGAAVNEITIVKALDAIRKQDFVRGIALARQVFSDTSTNSSDHLTLGRIYMAAGRVDEAGKEFRRAVELGPGVPASWLTYVQYLVQTRQIDQAKAVVEAARKKLPADRATLTLAQCSLLLGDTKQAEDLVRKTLSDDSKPADSATLRVAATAALAQNRFDEVNQLLDKLDRLPGLSPVDRVWGNRVRIGLLLNKRRPADLDQALALADQNLRINPRSIEDQGLKAGILATRPGGRAAAVTILERLRSADRLGPNERFLLAQLYLGQPDEQKYKDEMLKLLNLNVKNPQHLAHFVNFWIGHNQLDQADRWLAALKKVEPEGLRAVELEAKLLDLRKRKPELLALLEAYSRQVPDQIGSVADLLNRYGFAKEAEAAYRAFAVRDSKQPERVLPLAQFLARQDRVTEAMEILNKAWTNCRPEAVAAATVLLFDSPSANDDTRRQVEAWVTEAVRKQPDSATLTAWLGVIWIRQKRYEKAEGLYRRVLSDAPRNVDALNNLAWLLALRGQGNTQEALGLINRAIDLTGATSSLFDTRAVILIRAGQPDGALRDLDVARAGDPRNPSFAVHLAWAYQEKGRTDEARQAFQQARDLGWKVAKSDPLERTFMEKLRSELGQ